MLDLLVIGAGLAGLTAAIYAAQAGLSVRVVTKGMNALHWAAGTIDLFGYLPDNTPVDAPLAALAALPDAHPLRHVSLPSLRQTLDDLQQWLAEEGLPYVGNKEGANLWLPSAVGAKRPTYLAPAAQAKARLDDPSPLLVVGFDRYNDFYPALIAENLRRQGHAARGHTLPLALITGRHAVINAVYLAEGLDDLTRLDGLAEVLRQVVQPGERVVFPALLGMAQHSQVIAKLESAVGASVAELATLPPSVPGLRLHRALVRKLARHGGRVESNMTAINFGAEGNKIAWVETESSARPLRHRAHAYLLATGGVLGGGFTSDHKGNFWERVFNLPLVYPTHRGQWFQPEFLDQRGHPIFQAGVQVDKAWQPVDGEGQRVYRNLWAAGNLLAHADALQTRSHEAIALASGAAAAHSLLAQRHVVEAVS